MPYVTRRFEIEVEEDDDAIEHKRYTAWCKGLSGCEVHASSEAAAIRKIKEAIGIWIDLANRQIRDDPRGISELIDI